MIFELAPIYAACQFQKSESVGLVLSTFLKKTLLVRKIGFLNPIFRGEIYRYPMFTKEEAREKITKLSKDFGDRIDYIKNSGQYKEAQIEDEFIKPLFKYLNWNVSNEGIRNPSDREFIVQPK